MTKEWHCPGCNYEGEAGNQGRGVAAAFSTFLTVYWVLLLVGGTILAVVTFPIGCIGWVMFLLFGLLLSWARPKHSVLCPDCKGEGLVPLKNWHGRQAKAL